MNHLNGMSHSLEAQWQDTVTEAAANVADVNVMAKDLANLNRAIRNNTVAGLPSNELADQRDLLVEKIATLTGAVAERIDDGQVQVNVKIGGTYLVSGVTNSAIKLVTTGTDPRTSTASIQWAPPTDPAAPDVAIATTTGGAGSVGELSGQLKTINAVVPAYLKDLDGLATQLIAGVNGQQTSFTDPSTRTTSAPYTVNGDEGADLLGGTNASDIQVIAGKTAKDLAISSGNPKGANPVLDGNNALAMSRRLADANGPDADYRALVVRLGVEAQSVTRSSLTQAVMARDADDARESVSGVSLNEEMTNLVKYQHSFSAAAKFISTVDSTIEALLNMVR